ncbi:MULTISPECIES: hypothetical protein [Bradyrhizobium]|uniref:Integrase n=1 Tax=Bradyrhizobium algeriense TaxID=634784 RepID=A0ABU8BNM7_9BRAD
MARVTEQHLLDWRDALLASKLSPVTVKDGYVAAMKLFFGWSKRMKRLATNPAAIQHAVAALECTARDAVGVRF